MKLALIAEFGSRWLMCQSKDDPKYRCSQKPPILRAVRRIPLETGAVDQAFGTGQQELVVLVADSPRHLQRRLDLMREDGAGNLQHVAAIVGVPIAVREAVVVGVAVVLGAPAHRIAPRRQRSGQVVRIGVRHAVGRVAERAGHRPDVVVAHLIRDVGRAQHALDVRTHRIGLLRVAIAGGVDDVGRLRPERRQERLSKRWRWRRRRRSSRSPRRCRRD